MICGTLRTFLILPEKTVYAARFWAAVVATRPLNWTSSTRAFTAWRFEPILAFSTVKPATVTGEVDASVGVGVGVDVGAVGSVDVGVGVGVGVGVDVAAPN